MSGPTIQTTWPELKKMAAEFLRAAPTASTEEVEAGMKAFGLGLLGCQFEDTFFGRIARTAEAPALFRICSQAYMDRVIELRGVE
jgi:hypothetical protein